jgi:hypothetical protein
VKVYVLFCGDYSSRDVRDVFTTVEAAMESPRRPCRWKDNGDGTWWSHHRTEGYEIREFELLTEARPK